MPRRLRSRPGDKHLRPIFRNRHRRRRAPGHLRSGPGTGLHLDRHLSWHQRRLCFRQEQLVRPPWILCSTGNFSTNGWLAGGTLGGNYQWGQFVLGIEGDGDWKDVNATTSTNCTGFGCTTRSDWLATVRGRAGYAVDRILFYGTGGGAFGNLQAAAGAPPSAARRKSAGPPAAALKSPSRRTDRQGRIPLRRSGQPSLPPCELLGYAGTPVATTVSLTENSSAPASTTNSGNTRWKRLTQQTKPRAKPGAFCLQPHIAAGMIPLRTWRSLINQQIASSRLISVKILADVSAPSSSAKWASISAVSNPSSVNPMT